MPVQPRQPNGTTFDLGHYEQMQINLLFAFTLDDAGLSNELDLETLASLRSIFQAPGTISVTRQEQDQ